MQMLHLEFKLHTNIMREGVRLQKPFSSITVPNILSFIACADNATPRLTSLRPFDCKKLDMRQKSETYNGIVLINIGIVQQLANKQKPKKTLATARNAR